MCSFSWTPNSPNHQKAKMLVLLAGIFVVHIATVIMLFVSTIANVWVVADRRSASVGLWKNCSDGSCEGLLPYGEDDALKAVQAFMILSIIFSVISLVVFVFQLFTMEKGNRFFLSGATMLVCWLCIMVGVSIYTHHYANGDRSGFIQSHHGYCFILTWICFCFSFIIGILYLVLRKK
ncbi:epithelial membrane protein 1 isoform X1 [Pipistrellus kuhlii]|nr:epithelial membrane protein 1 isoform X1 [Pipistrellus kuhlii]